MAEGNPTVASPERDVRLLSGELVTIKPWKLNVGQIMRKRIAVLFGEFKKIQAEVKAGDQAIDYEALIDRFEGDVIQIVRDTLGVDDEWMNEKLAYEDLFTLAQAIMEVCIWRGEDGGGLLGKLMGVAGGMTLVGHPEAAAEVQARVTQARKEWAAADRNHEAKPSETSGSQKDSPSSPGGGEQTPKPSEGS